MTDLSHIELPLSLTRYLTSLPFPPSKEQDYIIRYALATEDNLLLSALAGAAKTSTLKMLAHAFPDKQSMVLAFNKRIADELREEMPGNCECLTLNSLGHRTWSQRIGGKCSLSKNKMFGLIKDTIDAGDYDDDEREVLNKEFGRMLSSMRSIKAAGHIPDATMASLPRGYKGEPIHDDSSIRDDLDDVYPDWQWDFILLCLEQSATLAFNGVIDFDDQLLFPSLFKCAYPLKAMVYVDEVQDLSELNHRMLAQLVTSRKRIIAVGDQCQAIYGFRGAHEDGMATLQRLFDMHPLFLTVTFRCPQEVVDHVLWRAPAMKSFDKTPSGSVTHLAHWGIADLPDSCAILCRNNAPIISLAGALMREGRYPTLPDGDIATQLSKLMKSLGPRSMAISAAKLKLAKWRTNQLRRVKNTAKVNDTHDAVLALLGDHRDLGSAMDSAERLFNSRGSITMTTCHRSKGSEWDNVFILDEHLMGIEGQEPNLRYVAATRARRHLTYITTEGCDFAQREENPEDLF